MTERYTRVYTLESNQYQTGAPVIVEAGALLKDDLDDSILAQLKLKSVIDDEIETVTVGITLFDDSGELLGSEIEHQYVDLSVKRDESFGYTVLIPLPKGNARKFTVRVLQVVFKDHSKWSAESFDFEKVGGLEECKEAANGEKITTTESLSEWKGCEEKCEESKESLYQTKDLNYEKAKELSQQDTVDSLSRAKEIMEQLNGWRDSEQKVEEYNYRINSFKYDEAVSLSKQDTVESLTKACHIMESLNGWMDASKKMNEYQNRIQYLQNNAQNKTYEIPSYVDEPKAQVPKKNNSKMLGIVIAAVVGVVLLVVGFSQGRDTTTSTNYQIAGMADFENPMGVEFYSLEEMELMGNKLSGHIDIYSDDTVDVYIYPKKNMNVNISKGDMILDEKGEANAIKIDENTKTYFIEKEGKSSGSLTVMEQSCFYFTDEDTAYYFVGEGIDPSDITME